MTKSLFVSMLSVAIATAIAIVLIGCGDTPVKSFGGEELGGSTATGGVNGSGGAAPISTGGSIWDATGGAVGTGGQAQTATGGATFSSGGSTFGTGGATAGTGGAPSVSDACMGRPYCQYKTTKTGQPGLSPLFTYRVCVTPFQKTCNGETPGISKIKCATDCMSGYIDAATDDYARVTTGTCRAQTDNNTQPFPSGPIICVSDCSLCESIN